MKPIRPEHFGEFFQALHNHQPYGWQRRLAEAACAGHWPGAIDLPTGSGKTAAIDAAIFALACQASLPAEQRTAPRRIFFCVNRRVIVDEAYRRARHIAGEIWKAEQSGDSSLLAMVAAALRQVSDMASENTTPPLDVLELHGGIYRDNRWARSITQPMVVATTIDQLGSRLLFRGFGVSSGAAPIQAALIAYDSLILLDEAHISEPFRQTLENVQNFLQPKVWTEHEQGIGVPAATIVPMTATPNEAMQQKGLIQLDDNDRANESLRRRLSAAKPARLKLVTDVAKEAVALAVDAVRDKPAVVGIIVNRVATARAIYDALHGLLPNTEHRKGRLPADATVELVIGSMRPFDRNQQSGRLQSLIGPSRPERAERTGFVVATQCLEVGADYDFDVLITECASLDALRQRFGRLNRAGRPIEARGHVLANKRDVKPEEKLDDAKPVDPIYGNALSRTWHWLNEHATDEVVDFRVDALPPAGDVPKNLLAPAALLDAPVMLPAYIDLWCQTSPRPTPSPDVELFLHGPQRGEPDVQICWRADLLVDGPSQRQWLDIVSLLPPTTNECLTVPISRFRRWLRSDEADDGQFGDLLGVPADESDNSNGSVEKSGVVRGVIWRGAQDSVLLDSANQVRPGDTIVLPAALGGWNSLGHIPPSSLAEIDAPEQTATAIDIAEDATFVERDRAVLRIHPCLRSRLPAGDVFDDLFEAAKKSDDSPSASEWRQLLAAADLKQFNNGVRVQYYPDRIGVVFTARQRAAANRLLLPSLDDGEDAPSRLQQRDRIFLDDHRDHVLDWLRRAITKLSLTVSAESLEQSAIWHDVGKADDRFQAMLRRNSRSDAYLAWGEQARLLAKSGGKSLSRFEMARDRERAGLPDGFRHEMLSTQMAGEFATFVDDATRELVLHLIAAHHGHARPFAPVVVDDELPDVQFDAWVLSAERRAELVPLHRLDSGVAERFWTLTRRFGWWGLAYLEAILRLADQQASAAEDTGRIDYTTSSGSLTEVKS